MSGLGANWHPSCFLDKLMSSSTIKKFAPSVLWVLLSAVGIFLTLDYMGPLPTFKLGAAFWPQIILGAIIVVSIFQIVSSLIFRDWSEGERIEGLEKTDAQDISDQVDYSVGATRFKTLATFILPIVYVYGMHQFGFFFVTPIFLPLYMYVMGVRQLKKIFFVSVGLYATIIFLFVSLVYTPLPQGSGAFHSLNGQFLALFQ